MKGWQLQAPGPLEKTLALRDDIPRPTESSLGPDDVLVKIIACGLNPADYRLAELGFLARAVLSFPKTAGMDLSGQVVAVGANVTDLKPGDTVAGRVNPLKTDGALSEYAVMTRDRIAVIPEGEASDPVIASGVTTAALTAYQTIAPYVDEGKGDKIFVNGGSGGVGSCCIQIAKLLGCHVTVSCSTAKVDLCRDLGADDIIDYKQTDVTAELKRRGQVFKLIVDNVGDAPADLYSASRSYLGDARPYVFVGGHFSLALARNLVGAFIVPTFMGGVRGRWVQYLTKDTPDELARVLGWFAEGKLKILVDSTFGFADGKVAFQKLQAGSATGKIIVTM